MKRIAAWLLLVATWCSPALALSVDDAFLQMQSQTVTGVTIITHGFAALDSGGDYMRPLATAIRSQLLSQSGDPVWLLDYELSDDGAQARFSDTGSVLPTAPGGQGHAVLLFDWGPESNEDTRWWAESAGDALFSLGTGLGLFDPSAGTAPPVQMIGHSFGTVVTTEAVERLAGFGVTVDQVTLLDPHDFDQADVPTYDEAQAMHQLGAPAGYGATLWENVQEADVYYQTRGNQDPFAGVVTADPLGRPIPGAYNRLLDGADELPAGNPYAWLSADSDHSYVNHTFYTGTVLGALPAGADAPAMPTNYSSTGWAHSIHNVNRVPMPAPVFYGADQDHLHTDPLLAFGDGSPNLAGLATLGLDAQSLTSARFAPVFEPGDIVNGDFESGAREDGSEDLIAGWSHHGGGGQSLLGTEGNNRYLRLETVETINPFSDFFDDNHTRIHNRMVVPAAASGLMFDLRVASASLGAMVELLLGETVLGSLMVDQLADWQSQILGVPIGLRDTVSTLTVRLIGGEAVTDFDNFRFLLPDLPGDFNADGQVDASDYAHWREHLGAPFGALHNDPTGLEIGHAQLQAWLASYGNRSPVNQTTPEPAALALWLVFCMAVALRYRGRAS